MSLMPLRIISPPRGSCIAFDQQRQITNADYLASFHAAGEPAVGCAPLDGGDFDAAADLSERDTVAVRRSEFTNTRLRSSNSHGRKSRPSRSNRSKAQRMTSAPSAAAEQLNGCAIS
jgi:hypothetical protein